MFTFRISYQPRLYSSHHRLLTSFSYTSICLATLFSVWLCVWSFRSLVIIITTWHNSHLTGNNVTVPITSTKVVSLSVRCNVQLFPIIFEHITFSSWSLIAWLVIENIQKGKQHTPLLPSQDTHKGKTLPCSWFQKKHIQDKHKANLNPEQSHLKTFSKAKRYLFQLNTTNSNIYCLG